MKRYFGRSFMFGLILFVSFLFMTASVMAQGLPYATYGGGFNFDGGTGELTFNNLFIESIVYDDGAGGPPTIAIPYSNDPYNDPLIRGPLEFGYTDTDGYLNLGAFQQDTVNQNLFYAASTSNFSITAVDGYGSGSATTYLTANVNSFEVIHDGGGWYFNLDYALNNVTNLAYPGPDDSEFIQEFETNAPYSGVLSMSFTFSGPEGFGATTYGAVDGLVAAPEPVSSVLFIVGSTVLAARRFRKIISIS